MRASQQLIIEGAYAAWAGEDLSLLGACLHDNAVSVLHLPSGAWPMSGALYGKPAILNALDKVSRDFAVVEYRPLKMSGADDVWTCRARIHYVHRTTGLSYEATISNVWRMQGNKIRSYEVCHDAARLRAFFGVVSQAGVEA